jgi:hypothetical protein
MGALSSSLKVTWQTEHPGSFIFFQSSSSSFEFTAGTGEMKYLAAAAAAANKSLVKTKPFSSEISPGLRPGTSQEKGEGGWGKKTQIKRSDQLLIRQSL